MKLNHSSRLNSPPYHIQVVQRAFSILDALLEGRHPLGLEQICIRTGLPKATAFRIVMNLIAAEMLVETNEGYWLGIKNLRLGALAEEKLDFVHAARPVLVELRDRTNEAVHLAILNDDMQVVYLEKINSQRTVGIMMSRVGHVAPCYCTGLGKALLAYLPEERVRAWASRAPLKAYTPNTFTDLAGLLAELRVTRQRGYSVDNSEHEENVRCIAAPLRDRTGKVIAAISIAGPDTRFPQPLAGSEMAGQVVQTAERISSLLGYSGLAWDGSGERSVG
jgi:DNA-binding IclR family transcriptional regulator